MEKNKMHVNWKYLLILCEFCSIINLSEGTTDEDPINGLSCTTDYKFTINCILKRDTTVTTQYWLDFKWINDKEVHCMFKCPLVKTGNHHFNCTFMTVNKTKRGFRASDHFNVTLCYDFDCYKNVTTFWPSVNVKPTAPTDLKVQSTPDSYNISWTSGYENHITQLTYQISIQKYLDNEIYKEFRVYNTFFLMNASKLDPDQEYLVKVRSGMLYPKLYKGEKSEWSMMIRLKTSAKQASRGFLKLALPVCLVVAGLVLYSLYIPLRRVKIEAWLHVPSPAPFFQPLFKDHNGNLNDWLASQGNLKTMHEIEELQITNTLIIESKSIKEDHCILAAANTPLQDQSPYVDASLINWVFSNTNGPWDISHTQHPSSTQSYVMEIIPSPPEFEATSKVDSGCEELMLNPVSPWPETPLSL